MIWYDRRLQTNQDGDRRLKATHRLRVLTVPDPLASPWQTRRLSEKGKGADKHNFTPRVTSEDD